MIATKFNMTMLTDFYELTMANGYLEKGMEDVIAYFDLFFRKTPDGGGYAIMAGLEQIIEYLNRLKFSSQDIEFLRSKDIFTEKFLNYLENFEFACDIWAVPEGTPVFPGEPLVVVKGPIMQAQFIETLMLLVINHQSLIATKANRIVRAAQGRDVMEFGTRRAQGITGAVHGARAAYIGGCVGTACVVAERDYGVPAFGTMAHSWVQVFDSEIEAFRKYAEVFPHNCTFLVDTYNVLKSGVPNAIKVFDEVKPEIKGIRIDSGDMTYLSREARKMLDEAGHKDCRIIASNSFDEYIIRDILLEGACIDTFGVGERLITSKSEPVFGGVYKLVAIVKDGKMIPKIKISENIEKITTPGIKELYRLYEKSTGMAIADVMTLEGEDEIDSTKPYEIFDPEFTWKKKKIKNFTVRNLHTKIFENGKQVYQSPPIEEIRSYCQDQIKTLWKAILRFENPHSYYVDLSKDLWTMRQDMIEKHSNLV